MLETPRRVVVAALAVALLVTVAGQRPGSNGPLDRSVAGAGSVNTIDAQPVAFSGAGAKLAFAHYHTPYIISLDNKAPSVDYYQRNYLTPTGEDGKHKAYGGLLRDRPQGRSPLPNDWQATDMETDIRNAKTAGLDGFTLDILNWKSTSYHYVRDGRLLDTAAQVGNFKIMLMPDMSAMSAIDAGSMAALLAHFGTMPAAFHLSDGRLVVSPFKAEGKSASWWSSVLSQLSSKYGIRVAFVPCFLNWRANASAFAPISYGFSNWGNRDPDENKTVSKNAVDVHALGKLWMQPVSVQDSRPTAGKYWEAGNTENLRASWQGAIDGNADWVQLTTWNDYSENSEFAPSQYHGWSFLDLSLRYLKRWKTGSFPAITKDQLLVSHRRQPYAARPSFPQTRLQTWVSGGNTPRNTVEVVSLLTAPASVTVTVGGKVYTWSAPAGQSAQTFPLSSGTVSAKSTRGGAVTASVTTPAPVTGSPYVQDLQYVAAISPS